MTCNHNTTRYTWTDDRATARFCVACGATLSMGPARDEVPAVAIEIRAASLAANGYPLDDAALIAMSLSELIGWEAFGADRAQPRGGDAGWLAHAIVVHHQLQEVDGCPARSVLDCTDPDCERHFGEHHAAPDHVELDVVAGPEPEAGIEVPVALSTAVDVPPGWSEDLDAMERAATAANGGAA